MLLTVLSGVKGAPQAFIEKRHVTRPEPSVI
jgi:hypothetical protein